MTDTGIATIPRPMVAGGETAALRRFHRDVTWSGGIREGGMGPGTIFESMRDALPKLKMTWDASSPEIILWRNEMTFDGMDWPLIEEYQMVPSD